MPSLLADVRPLRESVAYRRLWTGQLLSSIGTAMTNFAVALQVFLDTHSSAAVGGVGLATAIPLLGFGLFGGALADASDRRRIVLVSQSLMMLCSIGFAAQAIASAHSVWLLYGLAAVQSLLSAVNAPARRSFMPRLVRAELVPAAAALSLLSMHLSVITGPLLAGLIVPLGGLKACYLVDAGTFLASLYATFRLPAMRPAGDTKRPGVQAVREGLAFILRDRVLSGLLLADISATLLAMPIALFPAINAERFHGSPRTLGLLASGLAIGGVLGAAFSGPLVRLRRPGLGMLVAGAIWGAALAGFGAVQGLVLTLACLIAAGIADVSSVALRSAIIQLATPDRYRGRVNASEIVVGAGFPQLGNFRAGTVAQWTSPRISAVSGGLAAVVGAGVVAVMFPALVRYSARSYERVDERLGGG